MAITNQLPNCNSATAVVAREPRRSIDLLTNATALGLLWVAYSMVRGLTADQFSTAMTHASQVLDFQAAIGLPNEGDLQRVLIGQEHLIKAANIYYIAVHFPATLAFLSWVWLRHRSAYGRIRDALIATTAVGLVMHVAFPLAPPRMLGGFIHTAETIGPNPYDLPMSGAANQIAAMPSLHVGWALLVALGIVWISSSPWRYVALLHPLITTFVVVVTGNHYVTDAAVAVALVGVAWLALRGRSTHSHRRRGAGVEAVETRLGSTLVEAG